MKALRLILLAFGLQLGILANAQSFKVYQKNGGVTTYYVAKVDSVVFSSNSEGGGENVSSNILVGIWDCVSDIYYSNDDEPEVDDVTGEYVEFTDTELRLHAEDDLANDIWVDYTYDTARKTIKIAGWGIWYVLELTSTTLRVKTPEVEGCYSIIEFRKRSTRVKKRTTDNKSMFLGRQIINAGKNE